MKRVRRIWQFPAVYKLRLATALVVFVAISIGIGGANGRVLAQRIAADGLAEASTVYPASFSATGKMAVARVFHTATLLNNSQVLIAGGAGGPFTRSSAELYDSAGGTFGSTGSMKQPRVDHTATLLNNGVVLIAGGGLAGVSGAYGSCELYDPSSGTFT
jgi:Galactose oxidase, central domain